MKDPWAATPEQVARLCEALRLWPVCPDCSAPCAWNAGSPGTYGGPPGAWEPPDPSGWFCLDCGTDTEAEDYDEGPPPIATDPAWAVRALRAAGEVWGAHSVEIELPERPDPDDPPASNFLVDLIFAGVAGCQYMGEHREFPEAVCAALWAALDTEGLGAAERLLEKLR